jgi:hypothetical protein
MQSQIDILTMQSVYAKQYTGFYQTNYLPTYGATQSLSSGFNFGP